MKKIRICYNFPKIVGEFSLAGKELEVAVKETVESVRNGDIDTERKSFAKVEKTCTTCRARFRD